MKGRYRKLALIALGAAGLVLLLTVLLRPREPVYQGKQLSAWLNDLATTPFPEMGSQSAAKAIRAIGTNAMPYLIENLQAKDSRIREKFVLWTRRQTLVRLPFHLARERRNAACDALLILGDKAKDAIPEISALLDDKELYGDAFLALFAIGTNSIPLLRETCGDGRRHLRTQAAWLLAKLCSGGSGFATSYSPDGGTNKVFALTLTIGDEDMLALAADLKDSDPAVRRASAEALGNSAGIAKAAVPALTKALDDPDKNVRAAAADALKAIDPQAAAQASVK